MRKPRKLDDRITEDLLGGRVVDDEQARAVDAALRQIRHLADDEAPQPTAALASVLAEGLPEGTRVPVAAARHTSPFTVIRRTPRMLTSLLSGLAAKVALGVGAVAFAATGAGVAGVLPSDAANDAVQKAFNFSVVDDFPEEASTTGTVRSEEGRTTAEDARENRGNASEDALLERRAEAAQERAANAEQGLSTAREAADDTPAAEHHQIPDTVPVGPDAAEERRQDAQERRGDAGTQQQDAGSQQQDAGSQQQDAGSQQPERPAQAEAGAENRTQGDDAQNTGDAQAEAGVDRRPSSPGSQAEGRSGR
jgi:hypothetical protein